jgi:hypothetical protein
MTTKKVGKPFEKGKSGNPGGRKPLSRDIKASRHMTYEDLLETITHVRCMTVRDAKLLDLERMTLGERAIYNAYIKLDYGAMKYYEDRLWGKAKETVDIDIGDSTFKIVFVDATKKGKEGSEGNVTSEVK